jgi:membrane protein implicated in regulation of membrane protease activity
MQAIWDWLADNEWTAWFGAAFALALIETITLDLIFLMIAGGAASGALAALAGLNLTGQAIVAILVSVGLLGFVRPVARRHLRTSGGVQIGAAALVGRKGVVVEKVDSEGGLIRLAGEMWSARSYDGQSVIEPGKDVDVIEIDGATALVFEVESP